jgi:hypothetical protein
MTRKILAAISTLLLFLAIASPSIGSSVLLWVIIVCLGGFDLYLYSINYRINISKHRSLEYSGQKILLKEKDGEIDGSIDASSPYTLKIHSLLYYPDSLFRITQNGNTLEFTNQTKNAEYIVKEVLKVKGK